MNSKLAKLALDAGLINYVDLETPRRYFIDGNADLEEIQEFAESIIVKFIDHLTKANQLQSPLTTAIIATDFFKEDK